MKTLSLFGLVSAAVVSLAFDFADFSSSFEFEKVGGDFEQNQAYFYEIDLDKDPSERWAVVCSDLTEEIKQVYDAFLGPVNKSKYHEEWHTLTDVVLSRLSAEYRAEMQSFAECTGYSLHNVLAANLIYDFVAYGGCTSIVARNCEGRIVHGRNLDWKSAPVLVHATLNLNFTRNGKTLFTANTFAGYIWLWTGFKHGVFSISGNARFAGKAQENMKAIIANYAAIGDVIRTQLTEAASFSEAVSYFSTVKLMAAVYFIVGGTQPNEAVVLTRNQTHSLSPLWIGSAPKYPWFVVQTNYDHWNQPPYFDDRRQPAIASLNALGQCSMDTLTMHQNVMSLAPVKQDITVFTSVFSAALFYSNYTVVVW